MQFNYFLILIAALTFDCIAKEKAKKTYVFDGSKYKKSQPKQSLNTKKNKQFTCDGRQHCSQMTTYAEALFFLKNCPNVKMDGDDDGLPCERQRREGRLPDNL